MWFEINGPCRLAQLHDKPWWLRYPNSFFFVTSLARSLWKAQVFTETEKGKEEPYEESPGHQEVKSGSRKEGLCQCLVIWWVSRCIDISLSVIHVYPEFYDNTQLGPVVQRLMSTNPGLNFNLGFLFFCLKTFFWIIFSLLFRASNHQIVDKKIKTEFAFQTFISELKFFTNPGLS